MDLKHQIIVFINFSYDNLLNSKQEITKCNYYIGHRLYQFKVNKKKQYTVI